MTIFPEVAASVKSQSIDITDDALDDVTLNITLKEKSTPEVAGTITFPTDSIVVPNTLVLKTFIETSIINISELAGKFIVSVDETGSAIIVTFTTVDEGTGVQLSVEQTSGSDILFSTVVSDEGRSEIIGTTSPGTLGLHDVIVTNPDGGSDTLVRGFAYMPSGDCELIQFTLNLSVGINLVSIPVELEGWRMSDLAEYIGKENVSMIIRYDDTQNRFISYLPHFPDDSPANAPLECGEGYIILMKVEKEIVFEGNPCKDEIASPSLMPLMLSSDGQSTSIFVVTGSIRQEDTGDILNDVSVMIRNLRTGQVVYDVAGTLAGNGNYVATFVASSEDFMTYTGDKLEITAIDKDNQFTIEPVTQTLTTRDISDYVLVMPLHLSLPKKSTLLPNYPNPFNPETWIPFQLAQDTPVIVSIYNANGHLIRTISLGNKSAGIYITKDRATYWDGRSNFGDKVASGVYYYTLQAGDFKATRKMLIVK